MPTAIAEIIDVTVSSGMPSRPMTPKLTATVSASGVATSSPPVTERSRSAAMQNVISAICRMFRIFPCTITSVAAAVEASEPV